MRRLRPRTLNRAIEQSSIRAFASAFLVPVLLVLAACAHGVATGDDTLRLYVARHGQTDWNVAKRLQGQTDTDLNVTGRSQAEELGRRIAGMHFDRIYSSALKRSRMTADIAAGGARVEHLAALNEHGIGAFEGLYVDGREPARQAEFERRAASDDDTLDGGESRQQFFTRVCTAVRAIREQQPRGNVLIVGHGGTNQQILRCFLGLSAADAESIHQSNDELYMIELPANGTARLWKFTPKDKLGEL